jgi:hypothetical protein
VIDDVVVRFEDAVRQPVLPHELPDIFLAVEFWCARRQWQQRDVAWGVERLGATPSGLIEEDDRVCARGHLGCDLVEMEPAWPRCYRPAAQARRRCRARRRPHRTSTSIQSVDREWRGGVSPSWPSDKSACSSAQPASRPGTTPLWVCQAQASSGPPPHGWESFFERLHGVGILPVGLRSGAQMREASGSCIVTLLSFVSCLLQRLPRCL